MADDAQAIVTELRADIRKYEANLQKQLNATRKTAAGIEARFNKMNQGVARDMKKMSLSGVASITALGAAAGLVAREGVRVLADFSQAMSTVAAVSQATGNQLTEMTAKARELGATTRFSATQAAEGMLFLARAGFDTDEILGSIEGTLQLAQAGALDLGRAADIASNILSGFRLEVDQTGRIVDVLALAANSANTDVNQLGEAMKFVAPVAAGLGVSVEEATAAIAQLSNNGLQASLAGTGLRRVLSELESPAVKSRKILAEIGLTAADVRPSVQGLSNVIETLAKAGLDTGQALELFGDRGGPAFEVLSSSIPAMREMNAELANAEGTAARVAKVMDDNLNGAILQTVSGCRNSFLPWVMLVRPMP